MNETHMETGSEDGSRDNNLLKNKYDVLEKNYRRLLEVTTALTEALEHAIKGDPNELEKTLNHCMEIYPELFRLHIRKPPRITNFRTAYNTSVSEEATDNGELDNIQLYEYFSKLHRTNLNSKDERTSSERDSRSPRLVEKKEKRQTSPGISFVKLNDDKKIPEIFQETSFEVLKENNVGGYPLNNNVNIMSLYPSKQSVRNISDNDSSSVVTPTMEREISFVKDNAEKLYTVKHPESDTDGSIQLRRSKSRNKNKISKHDANTVVEEVVYDDDFEKVIYSNNQQKNTENDIGFSIKIIPDSATSNKNSANDENKTCIIINKTFNSNRINNSPLNNEITLNSSTDQISLNVTIAKLHSLSSGLHEQTNIFQPGPVYKTRNNTPLTNSAIPSPRINIHETEEPTKIALLNSYGAVPNSRLYDEAFDQIKDDYLSIKYNLLNGSVKQKSLILQSLRLNLIHTLAMERSGLLKLYVDNDILNIHNEPFLLEALMPKEIINGWDLLLQQTTFKFLNTLSSMWKGRDYLSTDEKILFPLLKYFNEKFSMQVPSEAICKDMLIATFHKLSTRVNLQSVLVNAGISDKVLFSLLENRNSITPYRVRHTLGLLINLCVNKHGRKSLEPLANEVIILLATLLSSKEKKIVSSAARLLYILMANEKFHKEINKMEITKIVEEAMKTANKRIKLQLETLVTVMEKSKPHTQLYDADSEELYLKNIEPEIDELEEEVEIGEPGVVATQTESYKKYESENSQKITNLFSNEDQIKDLLNKNVQNGDNESENISLFGFGKGKSKRKNNKKGFADDQSCNEDTDTIETGSISNAKEKSTKNDGRQTPESQYSKDTKKDKNKKGKKRDSDTFSMLSSNYTLFKEALDNIIDDQTNYNIIPEIIDEDGENAEVTKSITITQEKVSVTSKTVGTLPVEEAVATPIKITQNESTSRITRPSSQLGKIVTQQSRKHSLFRQNSKNTYDYEYCEETKEIQLPLQPDNLFSAIRESPLKGLLEVSKESKPNTPNVNNNMNINK